MAKTYLIILIPFFLIILQNDLGTALVFLSFILVFYREGLSGNVLIVFLVLFTSFVFLIIESNYFIVNYYNNYNICLLFYF